MRDFGLDHIVILVSNLTQAMSDYQTLGFTVTMGGEHPRWGTHNAIIPFHDGSYLELIAVREAPSPSSLREVSSETLSPADERVRRWATSAEGLVDFALLPSSTRQQIMDARGRGLVVAGPLAGARVRPDGKEVAWEFGFPEAPDLPFLCGDVTARVLRVPDGKAREHENGVVGVSRIVVVVDDAAESMKRYSALLGMDPLESEETISPHESFAFSLGATTIQLLGAAAEGGNERRPASASAIPFQVELLTASPHAVLDETLLHGARLKFVGPLETYKRPEA